MNKIPAIAYRNACSDDLEEIKALLIESRLPVSDIEPGKIDFIIAAMDNTIIGCIGLERFGSSGLLRSFAVSAPYRNQLAGSGLFLRLINKARMLEVEQLHLLTTTAESYFRKKGFATVPRDEAPESIRSTAEFSTLCPSNSAYMIMNTQIELTDH